MIEKEAFILGASKYCKEAGIVGEDRDAFVQLVADGDEQTIAMVKAATDEKKKEQGEWPPVPEDESPGDEIATAQIDREAFEKAVDPAMSVDLEFRDSELDAMRKRIRGRSS